jgi:hypothetical protein
MAALDPTKNGAVYMDGRAERTVLYAVKNVNTNDTIDLAAEFTVPKVAVFLSTTGQQKGVCTIAGTVITIPTASLTGEAGYLLVWGSAA